MAADERKSDFFLDRLALNATKYPDKLATAFLASGPNGGKVERQLTYRQLAQQSSELASRLLTEHGLKKGDRAVLVYPPSLDFMLAFVACLKAGIVAVPVFPPNPLRRDTLHMFSTIVANCQAQHALTNAEYQHAKKLTGLRDAFTKLGKNKNTAASWPEQLQWIVTSTTNGSSQPTNNSSPPPLTPSPDDLAFLQYTSGSTSEPKGVMITHGNLAHNLDIITNELKAVDDTVVVSWLPQYHDMGLIGSYLGVLYCGGTGYYLSPLSFLQRPMLWMEAVSKYQATHLQAPNFAFKLTARKFQASNYDNSSLNLSSVRHVINAAEPVDEDSMDSFDKAFGPFGFGRVIYPTYGLAEHTVFVCSGGKQLLTVDKEALEVDGKVKLVDADGESSKDAATSRLVGCGYPARQGVDVRIVNVESSRPVDEDVVGEIWIRSPSKAAGYFQKAKETKEDFHALLDGADENDDGYLRTGDLGFLHGGELFICGRIKDLIIIGGRNYYPQDIESTAESASDLLRPGCSAAFTIDTIHQGGEEVALVVELREPPSSKNAESVCQPLSTTVRSAINQEHYLGVSEIIFLQPRTVPKTSSGKIARSWCRKAYAAGTLKVVYRRSFKTHTAASLEIDQADNDAMSPLNDLQINPEDHVKVRSMSKEEILAKLTTDVSRLSSLPPESIDKDVALVTMMDSLSISQLKGFLESRYGVRISDEYLFRESTTLTKLVEVVKLGYAPDDGDGAAAEPHAATAAPGQATGLAGALGCPPGVVCVIL